MKLEGNVLSFKFTPELLRGQPIEDLQSLLEAMKEKQFEMKIASSVGGHSKRVEKPNLVKKLRRDIARVETILRER